MSQVELLKETFFWNLNDSTTIQSHGENWIIVIWIWESQDSSHDMPYGGWKKYLSALLGKKLSLGRSSRNDPSLLAPLLCRCDRGFVYSLLA